MSLRKILVQGFYYYWLLVTILVIFLCISAGFFIYDGSMGAHLPGVAVDKSVKTDALYMVCLLIYQLTGLFGIIVLRRKQAGLKRLLFAMIYFIIVCGFVLPTLLLFAAIGFDIAKIR